MALTPAERMRRNRERLKNNPDKHEEQRKKQLERVKTRKRKICEMTVEEKQKQREIWQKHKKAQTILKHDNETDYNEDKIVQCDVILNTLNEVSIKNNENDVAHKLTNEASFEIAMTNFEEPKSSEIDLTVFDEYEHEPKRKKYKHDTDPIQQENKENSHLESLIDIILKPSCSFIPSSVISLKETAKTTVMKPAKIIVKRRFQCELCSGALSLNRISKCMACKKWLCWDCSSGQIVKDYICDPCLLGDME